MAKSFQPGDDVIWWKGVGGKDVFPVKATVLGLTEKRVKIAARDPDDTGEETVTRHVSADRLEHLESSDNRKTKKGKTATQKQSQRTRAHAGQEENPTTSPRSHPRLYTLEVFLLSGNLTSKFVKKNRVVSRTIQIRGDQTLEDLHHTIFDAFARWEEHMYEFQFGGKIMDPENTRYVLPSTWEIEKGEVNPPHGRVDQTTLDSLNLKVDDRFAYRFDFGDDWWHQINVEDIADDIPRGKFPRITHREGANPPQYPDEEE